MANLIGTAPNQVPVNGMLGRMAFQDLSSYDFTGGALPGGFTTLSASGPTTFSSSAQITGPSLLGYGPGAGGTVTQATSKSTAVTLNKPTGQITTHNAALAAGSYVFFTFNNTLITSTSVVVVAATGGGTGSEYQAWVSYSDTGVAVVCLRNNSGSSASDAVGIRFNILAGATS